MNQKDRLAWQPAKKHVLWAGVFAVALMAAIALALYLGIARGNAWGYVPILGVLVLILLHRIARARR